MHKPMKIKYFIFCILISSCVNSQDKPEYQLLGGRCEGCEAIFENKDKQLNAVDTLPEFDITAEKLKLTGTVYETDGKTPAEGVVLYIYHTNEAGIYPTRGDEENWAKRHGYLRGWIKTGNDGQYTFYTSKPGTYPSRTDPAHIHVTVLEPDGSYYWIHDFNFHDDPLLSDNERNRKTRGGDSGIIKLKEENDLLIGERNITLRMNL